MPAPIPPVHLEPGWRSALQAEFQKEYFHRLYDFVRTERRQYTIYPPPEQVLNSFHLTPFESARVVILGQDPYHGPGQAEGLCFSVARGTALPPSLQNIFKEYQSDLGLDWPPHGSLVRWAEQGVLLLNAVLTVRQGQANSHQGRGWEVFTTAAIAALNNRPRPVFFILWGAAARKKAAFIDQVRHGVVTSPHPSPLSAHRGFFGSRPFTKANDWLRHQGMEPVDWRL